MKKPFIVIASLALIGCFAAIGCGGETTGDSANQDAAQSAEEAIAVLMERLEANGGHIDSVMTAPEG